MPRHIKFGIMILCLVFSGGVAYFYNLQQQVRHLTELAVEVPQPYLTEELVFEETAPKKIVTLFFPSTVVEGLLEEEEFNIHSAEEVSVEAKQIIAGLIEGSHSGFGQVLPPETKLREIYMMESGLMVVDLTREVSALHPGGVTGEVSSIYSVVNSLTLNLPAVRKVKILVEGAETETLAGHVDLRRPLGQDLSMTVRLQVEDTTSVSE